MTLYVSEVDISTEARVASRADRKRADGWVECGTCLGMGIKVEPTAACVDNAHVYPTDCPECSWPCPDCVDGLVPPDEMIDAGARGGYEANEFNETPWNDASPPVQAHWRTKTKATLVEAARTEKE